MTMMACQIFPYRVEARSVECKTACDWLLLGLLRQCDFHANCEDQYPTHISAEILAFLRTPNATAQILPKCPTTPVTTAAAQPKFQSHQPNKSTIASPDSSQATAQQRANTKMPLLPTKKKKKKKKKKNLSPQTKTKNVSSDTAQALPS